MSLFHIRFGAGDGVRPLIDRYASGETSASDDADIRRHLASCPSCAKLLEETLRVRRLVRGAVGSERAPERLRLAIREMIRSA